MSAKKGKKRFRVKFKGKNKEIETMLEIIYKTNEETTIKNLKELIIYVEKERKWES